MTFVCVLDHLILLFFAIQAIYLLVFAVASKFSHRNYLKYTNCDHKRIAVLIPAYKEDSVILECVMSCLNQDYNKDNYDVIVISDKMKESTNTNLESLPIILHKVSFENSTKAKSLNFSLSKLENYDYALILDADNVIGNNFLRDLNTAFANTKAPIIQAHRKAKNINNDMAFLDAVSEEINNSIFRLGHVNLGFSGALIGSGMAFEFNLLKEELEKINAIGGFDRALELTMFKLKKKIAYIDNLELLDEKIQTYNNFARQRKRWMSAQLHYLTEFIPELPKQLRQRNKDFINKFYQQLSLPRLLLLGISFIISSLYSFFDLNMSIKWWIVFLIISLSLFLAIPQKYVSRKLFCSIIKVPIVFYMMFINLFSLKGANKTFIHTKHGVK